MKHAIAFIVFILLAPISFAPLVYEPVMEKEIEIKEKEEKIDAGYNFSIKDYQFGAFVYTKCNGVEKTTSLLDALLNPIDVDNNASTGVDGKDIKINAFILPYPEQFNDNFILVLSFVFRITLLGEEIKNSDFEAYAQIDLNGNVFRAGIGSPYGEELPREARIVFTVVPYLLYSREPEYYINLEPVFDGNEENMSIFGEYIGKSHQYIQIDFNPAITTIMKFVLHGDKAGISVERDASRETTLKIVYKGRFNANMTIENIPTYMAFNMSISERRFEYESNDEFNITMIFEGRGSKFITVKYIPTHILIEGRDGGTNVMLNSRKTEIIISDRLKNPSSFIKISNLTGNISLSWRIGRNGYVSMDGAKNAYVEIYGMYGLFDLKSVKRAEHFIITWNLSLSGSVFIDTNWEWFAECSVNFTLENFGIYIESDFLRADDFSVLWDTEPPSFSMYGRIEFGSVVHFAIMINGIWYTIF